jgi:hypothetical protein
MYYYRSDFRRALELKPPLFRELPFPLAFTTKKNIDEQKGSVKQFPAQ